MILYILGSICSLNAGIKVLAVTLCIGATLAPAAAQLKKHVSWNVTAMPLSDETALIILTAKIDKGWHIYTVENQHIPAFTKIGLAADPLCIPEGNVQAEAGVAESADPLFGKPTKRISDHAVFFQKVKLPKRFAIVKGTLCTVPCSESACGKPEVVEFSIPVNLTASN